MMPQLYIAMRADNTGAGDLLVLVMDFSELNRAQYGFGAVPLILVVDKKNDAFSFHEKLLN